jgi:hypothetical protein
VYDPCVQITGFAINNVKYDLPKDDAHLLQLLDDAMETPLIEVKIFYADHASLEYEKKCLIFLIIPGYPSDYFVAKQLEAWERISRRRID